MAVVVNVLKAVVSDQWSVFRKREGELVLFDASAAKLRMNGARGNAATH